MNFISNYSDRAQEVLKMKTLAMDLNGAPLNADSIIDKVNTFTSQKSIRNKTVCNNAQKVGTSPSVARKERIRHIFKK